MTAATLTLAEFLLARYAEDEAAAREAAEAIGDGHWFAGKTQVGAGTLAVVADTYVPAHIARHDPARMLADCEAKRQIVEAWRRIEADGDTSPLGGDMLDHSETTGAYVALEFAMKVHALPFADHPDYREEWKP